MNAISPAASFEAGAERFDTYVARAFDSTKATRHMRDRLIGQVQSGELDRFLLRSSAGLAGLPESVERRAALNTIDFAFEPLVVPGLSVAQATIYLQQVETFLKVSEAEGFDLPGPLWIDTVHHVCVFSVLFQLAAHLRRLRGCDRIILLHQGRRPEPRLNVVVNLLAKVHGITLVCLPMQGRWFAQLTQLTNPNAAIFSLSDMPVEAVDCAAGERRRGLSQVDLYAPPGILRTRDTVSGSTSFARRLGAAHLVLDYPQADRIRIRPRSDETTPCCPIEDWVFWPVLVAPDGIASSSH